MRFRKDVQGYSLILSTSLSLGLSALIVSPSWAQSSDSAPIQSEQQSSRATEPSQLPALTASDTSYLLGPGDALGISVIGYPEFDSTQIILPDGSVSLPLIGSIPASSQTLESLSQEMTQRLGGYLVNPVVNLNLQSMRPVWVTVAGAVTRPGPVQINAPSADDDVQAIPTLTTALTAAGGVSRNADIRRINVQRRQSEGNIETITLNLWDSLSQPSMVTELLLRDGDVISIPERALDDDSINPNLVARSTIAPTTVRVRVVGEVTEPGEIEVPPYSSLSSAVAVAGGPTSDAKLREVGFVRMNDAGEVLTETVDLRGLDDTYQVQDGDVIIVPRTGLATGLDIFGRIAAPFISIFRLF